MLQIALIDDKSYGLEQIKKIHEDDEAEFRYFSSFKEFNETDEIYDIIYLDYYLDNDGITGVSVLPEVKKRAKKLIGFSCIASRSEEMKEAGADEALTKN